MPFLGNIVSKLDELLSANSLTDARFQPRLFAGICQHIATKKPNEPEKLFYIPAKVTNLGEAVQIIPDDSYNLISYHRVLSNSYSPTENRSEFGDGNSMQRCTSDVVLTVIAFTNKLGLSVEQLEALFVTGFPSSLDKTFVTSLEMSRISVQPVSSTLDSVAIFSTEYRGETYFLKPESVMFQIRYQVQAVYKMGCFTICCD